MSEKKILFFPFLKRYNGIGKEQPSQDDFEKVSTHYINEVFQNLVNQNLLGKKDVQDMTLVKEFLNSVIHRRNGAYHPFSDVLDEIKSIDANNRVREEE